MPKATSQASVPLAGSTTDYLYDPSKGANRRTTAYSSEEFEKLPKDEQQRVLRNRHSAAASKARKRQRLQLLQEEEQRLQDKQQALQAQVAELQQQLAASQKQTSRVLKSCGCAACKNLLTQLLAASTGS